MAQPENSSNKTPTGFWTNIRRSHVTLGIALFLMANLLFWYFQPLSKVDPESLPAAHTWTWWATQEYLSAKTAPAVVLLGSSLMMHPVSRRDADYLNKDLDYVHHHKSEYLKDSLARALGLNDPSCFNFALPGSMISDDYIVTKALFSGDKKPRILVLGLSLRDFIDSGVSCPAATPPFRYLKRFVDINNIIGLAMPQVWQRIDYYVGNLVYLWNKKLDTQVILAEDVKSAVGPIMLRICNPSLIEKADPTKNLPSNLRSEVEEGVFIVKSHSPYSWEDNSAEYIKRYRVKHAEMFGIQAKFLVLLLDYCQAQNIAVLMVNMPITAQNMALMPAGQYGRYVALLKQTAAAKNCSFVDLNGSGTFQKTDFYDTSHMNATGGKKLLDSIAQAMIENKSLASMLTRTPPTELSARSSGELQ